MNNEVSLQNHRIQFKVSAFIVKRGDPGPVEVNGKTCIDSSGIKISPKVLNDLGLGHVNDK